MKFLMLLLVIFATGFSANGNAVTVRGAVGCQEWVEKGIDKQSAGYKAYGFWLLGNLSGFAEATNDDFLKSTEDGFIFAWMDNYCESNPVNSISEGAVMLYKDLKKKKH